MNGGVLAAESQHRTITLSNVPLLKELGGFCHHHCCHTHTHSDCTGTHVLTHGVLSAQEHGLFPPEPQRRGIPGKLDRNTERTTRAGRGGGACPNPPQTFPPIVFPALTLDPAAGPEMPAPSPGAVGGQIAVIKGVCPTCLVSSMHPPEGSADVSPISQKGKPRPMRCSDHPESLLSSASRAPPTDPWVHLWQLTRPFSRGPSSASPPQPGASLDAPTQECSEPPPASSSTTHLTNKALAFTG